MPFISFAQNHEDVPLWRVFKDQPDGFYVDVGASGPDRSVTTAFYNRGWSGLNVEPMPALFAELAMARPRDLNLQVAASDRAGTATLYCDPDPKVSGLTTLSAEQSASNQAFGFAGQPVEVPTATLAELCAAHADRPIDFLKIDVEGHEQQVIAGADWRRWRPRVVVVEATEPMSPKPSHHGWEPLLLEAGYLFALFDGLNRFYVREEDRPLLDVLAAPPCVFDEFVPVEHQAEIDRLRAEYAALRQERDAVWQQLHGMRQERDAIWWQLHEMRVRCEATEAEAARLRAGGPATA